MEPSKYLCKIWHEIPKQVKVTFFASWIFGLIAHIFVLINPIHNYDSVTWTPRGVGITLRSGRWMLYVYDELKHVLGLYNLPVLNGLFTLLMIALASCVIVKIFEVKDLIHCTLIGGIMICFPTVTSTLLFMFAAPYYGIAILLSVCAVWMADRKKWGFVGGAFCIAYALGTYQAYLPLTASLLVLLLIYRCLKENLDLKKGILMGIRFFLTLLLGVILYYGILQIFLEICNKSLGTYQGVSDMGKLSLSMIPCFVKNAYVHMLKLLKSDYMSLSGTIVTQISSLFLCQLPEKSTLKQLKALKTLVNTGVYDISKHFLCRLHVS